MTIKKNLERFMKLFLIILLFIAVPLIMKDGFILLAYVYGLLAFSNLTTFAWSYNDKPSWLAIIISTIAVGVFIYLIGLIISSQITSFI